MVSESHRIVRFILIGTLNALIMAAVVYVMMEWVGASYVWANVLAYVLAQVNNFLWSKYWVFAGGRQGHRVAHQVLLFLLAFGAAYGSQLLLTVALVELCGMNAYLAQFLGLLVYGAVNFLMNRRITFG